MAGPNRSAGYWHRERETMSAGAREGYQTRWLTELLALAWDKAPGVRRRLEQAKLTPRDFRSTEDLARLPVIRKSAMPDLQRADPPFGGFCTEPLARIRKIFVSPGPILEPMGPELGGFHAETGLFAGGFRRGDIVLNTFAYALTPAAHELDEALNILGCTVVPTGVGQTEIQVTMARTVRATGYVGTPSFLLTILGKAKEMGVDRLPFQVAQVGAEPFTETMRRELAETHGIMARQGFGTADVGMIA